MDREKYMREKILKEVPKRKTVPTVVKNHVESYKQKIILLPPRK